MRSRLAHRPGRSRHQLEQLAHGAWSGETVPGVRGTAGRTDPDGGPPVLQGPERVFIAPVVAEVYGEPVSAEALGQPQYRRTLVRPGRLQLDHPRPPQNRQEAARDGSPGRIKEAADGATLVAAFAAPRVQSQGRPLVLHPGARDRGNEPGARLGDLADCSAAGVEI